MHGQLVFLSKDILELKMTHSKTTSLCSFNCRSVKTSLPDIWTLCHSHDIVFLQEHWLLPFDLQCLTTIHPDFLAFGTSAVDVSKEVLRGRPYGGTGILYRRSLSQFIKVIDTGDTRMTAIKVLAFMASRINIYSQLVISTI